VQDKKKLTITLALETHILLVFFPMSHTAYWWAGLRAAAFARGGALRGRAPTFAWGALRSTAVLTGWGLRAAALTCSGACS